MRIHQLFPRVLVILIIASGALQAQRKESAPLESMQRLGRRSSSPNQPPQPPLQEKMSGMDNGMVKMMQEMHPHTFIDEMKHHATSGTSAEPNSTPTPMLMAMKGNWMLMFHGNAFILDTQQSSPRGGDKFFSTNWFMPMATRSLGPGQLTTRAMLSFEPATITSERYPLLFQQGETAYGVPIANGQHPHDFFMEVAGLYDWRLG